MNALETLLLLSGLFRLFVLFVGCCAFHGFFLPREEEKTK